MGLRRINVEFDLAAEKSDFSWSFLIYTEVGMVVEGENFLTNPHKLIVLTKDKNRVLGLTTDTHRNT